MTQGCFTFMPHQLEVFRWAKRRNNAALFHEMRLGKTLPSIRWANTRSKSNKILIVAPLGAHRGWREQLASEGIKPIELIGSRANRLKLLQENSNARFFLTNYEGLSVRGHKTRSGKSKPVASEIARINWDVVILDESTKIRSPKSQVTRICLDYLSQSPFRMILTGLPNPEGDNDFICQMLFLAGVGKGARFMGCRDYWEFRAKHMKSVGYDWILKVDALKELKTLVKQRSHFLTRREAGIGSKKIRQIREVALPPKIKKEYIRAETEYEVADKIAKNKLVVIGWMLQITGGQFPDENLQHTAKLKELMSLIKGELKNEPIVIWCHYTAEIESTCAFLQSKGLSARLAHGGTKKTNRETIESFQAGRFKYLVAQPKCFMMGEDFSRASVAIYMSNYYDYEIRRQSEDRVVHPSKKEPVLLIDIVAEDTIDVDLIEALSEKKLTSSMFQNNFMKKFLARKEGRKVA